MNSSRQSLFQRLRCRCSRAARYRKAPRQSRIFTWARYSRYLSSSGIEGVRLPSITNRQLKPACLVPNVPNQRITPHSTHAAALRPTKTKNAVRITETSHKGSSAPKSSRRTEPDSAPLRVALSLRKLRIISIQMPLLYSIHHSLHPPPTGGGKNLRRLRKHHSASYRETNSRSASTRVHPSGRSAKRKRYAPPRAEASSAAGSVLAISASKRKRACASASPSVSGRDRETIRDAEAREIVHRAGERTPALAGIAVTLDAHGIGEVELLVVDATRRQDRRDERSRDQHGTPPEQVSEHGLRFVCHTISVSSFLSFPVLSLRPPFSRAGRTERPPARSDALRPLAGCVLREPSLDPLHRKVFDQHRLVAAEQVERRNARQIVGRRAAPLHRCVSDDPPRRHLRQVGAPRFDVLIGIDGQHFQPARSGQRREDLRAHDVFLHARAVAAPGIVEQQQQIFGTHTRQAAGGRPKLSCR